MNPHPASLPLDLFTVKVMTLVTMLIVSMAAVLAWRINREVAGMRLFALGLLALMSGALLGLARIFVSGDAIVIACNVFMFGGMVTVAQGVRAFRGFQLLRQGLLTLLAGVVAVFFLYWLFVHESFGMRVGVISSSFILLASDASASMFRQGASRARLTYW